MPARTIRSAQEIFRPYFCLIGHSKRRALSRFALSGQELRGAKRCWPAPAPPRPSVMRYVPALCHAMRIVFYLVLSGAPPAKWNTFTTISNLYGSGGFTMGVVFLTETVITALFLVVIVGATSRGAPAGFAPIAIGLALTMFHLVAIPISNASLNPARSTATAIFGGAQALDALWLFWVAPILGGVIGGAVARPWSSVAGYRMRRRTAERGASQISSDK